MPDTIHTLICDALSYLRDPLTSKDVIFATEQECAYFSSKTTQEPIPKVFQKDKKPANVADFERNKAKPNVIDIPKVFQKLALGFDAPQGQLLKHFQYIANVEPRDQVKSKSTQENLSEIKQTLQRIAPSIKLIDEIPDDTENSREVNAKPDPVIDTEVILLACQTDVNTLEFLKNLGKAIDKHLARAKILTAGKMEQEKRWSNLFQNKNIRLIIATEGIEALPELMHLKKSSPHFFTLSPIAHYQSLEHKALLWKTLCQMLKK